MNNKTLLGTFFFLTGILLFAQSGFSELLPPDNHDINYEIDSEIERKLQDFSSPKEKISFLKTFIQTNPEERENSQNAHFQKASAILLMGRMEEKETISLLIDNLDYQDPSTKNHPSVLALAMVGEPATRSLLEIVKEEENNKRVSLAVQALLRIKGIEGYKKFVNEQKSEMPRETWKKLIDYAII